METVLATAGGVTLRKRESQLLFVDLNTGWIATAAFSIGLLTFIFCVSGGLLLAVAGSESRALPLGCSLLLIGTLFAALLVRISRFARMQSKRPSYELRVLLIVDLATQTLREPDGTPLSPLSAVRFRKRSLLSSAELSAEWGSGSSKLLVRCSRLSGGIAGFRKALRASRLAVL